MLCAPQFPSTLAPCLLQHHRREQKATQAWASLSSSAAHAAQTWHLTSAPGVFHCMQGWSKEKGLWVSCIHTFAVFCFIFPLPPLNSSEKFVMR